MNRLECQQLVDTYIEWLRHGLSVENIGDACEITTPFLDRHNDHLQIYAVRKNGKVLLSDDGYILADLRTSGLEFDTPKRKLVLQSALNGLGVREQDGELLVEATPATLGQRLHSLMQAMLAINDMFVMAQPRVASFFFEDVRQFMDDHNIRYSTRVKLSGKSGFDHEVDFLIPKSSRHPERLAQAINAPRKDAIVSYLFGLDDARAARSREAGRETEAYAFLNDQEQPPSAEVVGALDNYGVVPVLWSARGDYVEALAG